MTRAVPSPSRLRRLLPHLRTAWPLLLLLPVLTLAGVGSAEPALKAALVYKLAQFIEWPEAASGQFTICVLGDDPFDGTLDRLEGREIDHVPIETAHYAQSDQVPETCRILYLSPEKRVFQRQILEKFSRWPMLTLGETDEFAEQGGMIQFHRQDGRIGFIINPERARAAGLRIAAPLLSMSQIVETRSRDGEAQP